MMDDFTNDSKRITYLEKRALAKRERNIEDIKELVKTPAGRRFIWRIIVMSGIHNTGFIDNDKLIYFLAGKKEIGGTLIDDLQVADTQLFAKIQAEYYSELKSEEVMAKRFFEQDVKDGNEIDGN